jgi:hypothetical protein
MVLTKDDNGTRIQVFSINNGMELSTNFKCEEDLIVKLGSDVTITIDGFAVEYKAGDVIGLTKDKTYILSSSTIVHRI